MRWPSARAPSKQKAQSRGPGPALVRAEIHSEINRLADAGRAVVVISSYLPEIPSLSDRILVAKQGKVVVEFSATEAMQEGIMYAAIH